MVNSSRRFITTLVQRVNRRNESGVALLLTIILMIVFSLLAISLFDMLMASTQISGNHRLELRTLYIADAGLEDTIKRMCNPSDPEWDALMHGAIDHPETPFAYGKYDPYIDPISKEIPDPSPSIYGRYMIVCTGTIGDFRRAIEAYVNIIRLGTPDDPYFVAQTTSWQVIQPPPL